MSFTLPLLIFWLLLLCWFESCHCLFGFYPQALFTWIIGYKIDTRSILGLTRQLVTPVGGGSRFLVSHAILIPNQTINYIGKQPAQSALHYFVEVGSCWLVVELLLLSFILYSTYYLLIMMNLAIRNVDKESHGISGADRNGSMTFITGAPIGIHYLFSILLVIFWISRHYYFQYLYWYDIIGWYC